MAQIKKGRPTPDDDDYTKIKFIKKCRISSQNVEYHCSECGREYNLFDELWIMCDNCEKWFHGACVDVQEYDVDSIDKFHCIKCEDIMGPTTLKTVTNNHRHDQYEVNPSENIQAGTIAFVRKLKQRDFKPAEVLIQLSGKELTLNYLVENGFERPILVDDKENLGMLLPSEDFDIQQVMKYTGTFYDLDVIDSRRQLTVKMSMVHFVRKVYAERGPNTPILNCISLEVSKTRLSELIKAPAIVNKLSWVENCWPECDIKPYVSKYCLMSMRDSYTDFHIDFGGTSVWYHVLDGEKIFYLVEPTSKNLHIYEEWMRKLDQSEVFFPDMLEGHTSCKKLVLKKGQTLFIPTGWIHAVLTSQDSVVFGGNFLHSLNIKLQLEIHEMECKLGTANKFMFPYFELTHWYAVPYICKFLNGYFLRNPPPEQLIDSIKMLIRYLKSWSDKAKEETKSEEYSTLAPINMTGKLIKALKSTVENIQAKFETRQTLSLKKSETSQESISPYTSKHPNGTKMSSDDDSL